MSQVPPSPTSPPFSPPSSPTLRLVDQIEQPDAEAITIRYAETDDDVIAIHQFLLIVARPQMRAPVDPIASLEEIIRVTRDEVAIMAIKDGHLVGTLGLIHVPWWYAPDHDFMVDRWHFVLPQFQNGDVNRMLESEAQSIADEAGIEFINQGKIREKRGKLMIFPRTTDKQRA
jgi:hypothetical protein